MRFTITTLSLAVLFAGLTACNDGGSDVTAKPIKETEDTAKLPVKSPPKSPLTLPRAKPKSPRVPPPQWCLTRTSTTSEPWTKAML